MRSRFYAFTATERGRKEEPPSQKAAPPSAAQKHFNLPFHFPVSPGNHVFYNIIGTGIDPIGTRICLNICI